MTVYGTVTPRVKNVNVESFEIMKNGVTTSDWEDADKSELTISMRSKWAFNENAYYKDMDENVQMKMQPPGYENSNNRASIRRVCTKVQQGIPGTCTSTGGQNGANTACQTFPNGRATREVKAQTAPPPH